MNPHHRHPAVTWPALLAELDRECAQRRRVYPGQVEKGAMTPAEMDWQIGLAEAWRADATRFQTAFASGVNPLSLLPATGHALRWQDRRDGLARELAWRARVYPRQIAKGQATQADADRRIDLLQCLLAIYEDGFDFPGTPADFAPYAAEIMQRLYPSTMELDL